MSVETPETPTTAHKIEITISPHLGIGCGRPGDCWQGSDGYLCVPKIIDVMVRLTDAGCELRYLPQATEEDHGADLFKGTKWKCRAHLRSGGGAVCFGDPSPSIRACTSREA